MRTDGQDIWLWVQNSVPGGVVGAIIILVVGWIVARVVQWVVTTALRRTGLDRKLASIVSDDPGATTAPGDTAAVVGKIGFWLVMLFVLIAVFDALGLEMVTAPLTGLLAGIFEFLPRLFAAALILVLGWLLARIARQLVTSVLAAMGIDRLATRMGFADALGSQRLSGILGTVVFVLILLPVITAALDALQLEALTQPLSNMIDQVLAAIPNVVAAAILVGIAYFVGRVLADLVASVLAGLGFNTLPARLGLMASPPPQAAGQTPAQIVGILVQVAVVWFALIQALELLGFDQVALLMTDLLTLAGRILLGLIIFLVGLYLARLAANAIRASGVDQPNLLALAAQTAILVLTGAMALRQMGLANEIINLAFGLLLGAIAVAAALAFGLGGREVAGRQLERLVAATGSGEAEQSAENLVERHKSGEIATKSGSYPIQGPRGGQTGEERTVTEGDPFPPTPQKGQIYGAPDPD